jgi:hypothetical protein
MAKLPSLVVPVTIDSSGVDRGINSVNSKLRRGSGRFGGQGGFGSGGASSGLFVGGGSDLSDILLGGALASRFGRGGRASGSFKSGVGVVRRHFGMLEEMQRKASTARSNIQERINNFAKMGMSTERGSALDADLLDAKMAEYEAQMMTSNFYRREQRMGKAVRRGMRKRGIANAFNDISTLGGAISPIAGRFGMIGAAGMGLYKASQFNQTMAGQFANISQFEQSSDYGNALYFRDKYAIKQRPSMTQQFWLGAGKGSWMESGLSSFSSESERYVRGTGAMLANPANAYQSGQNPFMTFGGIPAKAALAPFSPAASLAVDIYQSMKRAFA